MQNLINQLNSLKNIPIENCKTDELIDINSIKIDISHDISTKMLKYLDDVKNPYLFKVGDTVVHLKFGHANITLISRVVPSDNVKYIGNSPAVLWIAKR